VPGVRAETEAAGGNSERTTSQYGVVTGIASLALSGQAGTENAGVAAPDAGGMICDGPVTYTDPAGAVTAMR